MNSLSYADDLVREYLLFRGLTKTASMFEAEKKTSKLRGGFQASKVIEQLISYIHSCNVSSLLELWEYLNRNFFLRLDKDMSYTVKKLEQSLKRYYLVYCCTSGHMDKVEEFFESLASELLRDPEWRHWFALRYIKSPSSDPAFELYFSKQWLDVFMVSLHNFLATIFQSVPLPKILNFNAARAIQRGLEQEVENLHLELKRLKELVESSETQLEAFRRKEREQQQHQQHSHHSTRAVLSPQRDALFASGLSERPSAATPTAPTPVAVAASASAVAAAEGDNGAIPSASSSTWLPAYGRTSGVGTQSTGSRMSFSALHAPTAPTSPPAGTVPASAPSTPAPASSSLSTPSSSSSLTTALATPSPLSSSGVTTLSTDSDVDEPFLVLQQDIYVGHTAAVVRARFSSEGTFIGSAAADGVVRVWNTATPTAKPVSLACAAEVTAINWDHKTERMLAVATAMGKVKLWNVQSEKVLAELSIPSEHTRIEDVAFSPSGSQLVTASNCPDRLDEGVLYIWSTKNLKPEFKIEIEPPAGVRSIAWNHNGTLLLTGTTDGMCRLFDMTTFSPIMGWRGHEGSVLHVRFSMDETTVFTIGSHGKLQQWSVNHVGKCERSYDYGPHTLPPEVRSAYDIALDPDRGRYFAVGARSGGLVFATDASKPVQLLGGHTRPVTCLDWHHNLILTGSTDHTLRVTKVAHQLITM